MEAEELRVVAEFASLAPSVHNTQPWRFVAHPDGIDVRSDPSRGLRYLDPSGRQLHISCGAATEFARLAIRSLGLACEVHLLPEAPESTLMARITTGVSRPSTSAEQRLIDAAPRRYTDRGPYSDETVAQGVLAQLRGVVGENSGCWLRMLDKQEDRVLAITLLSDAENAEASDPEYRSELARWRRAGHAPDGLPKEAYTTWDDEGRVTDVPLRDFAGRDAHRRPRDGTPPRVERDTIILLGTQLDEPYSWLKAGQALGDLLLALTDADLVSQPLGPVLDVPAARARLRHELGLVGYPQLLLRVGHGGGRPATGRRSVDDVFTVDSQPSVFT